MLGRIGKRDAHPGEISLGAVFPDLTEDATELARFWVNSERMSVAVGFQREWQPELLGSLFVEGLHVAAAAYAAQTELSEEEALSRLWSGLDEERKRLAR
jgi:hypothetical protein